MNLLVEREKEHSKVIIDEMQKCVYYKPKGRPPYSAEMIRFALLLRHTSSQAYQLLLEKFPMPSISLLQKIQQGGVDSLKALKRLHEIGEISSDILLMVDEMYLQKCTQYQAGQYVGEDENGDLYKGIVAFMVVGLKQSIPYVVQAIPEVKISGEWLAERINECIDSLGKVGFFVRAVCADNHSSNVNAFSRIRNMYPDSERSEGILHPSNNNKKTFLFFDSVHI